MKELLIKLVRTIILMLVYYGLTYVTSFELAVCCGMAEIITRQQEI